MEESEKKEHLEMLREAGVKAGIVPVQNLFNEDQRIEEVKRLGILDLNLSSESRYNSMTQVARTLQIVLKVLSISWVQVSNSVRLVLVLSLNKST